MASLLKEIRQNKVKFVRTCLVYFAFLGVGCGISILGPTLLDLQIAVNSSLSETSHLIQGRAVGYATGSVIAGFLLEMIDEQLVMGLTAIINGIALAVTAWNRTLWGIIFTLFVNGLTMSHVDTGSNVCIMKYWGKASGGFLQILHFMFTTGGLVAPLMVRPFLLERPEGEENVVTSTDSIKNLTEVTTQPPPMYSADDVVIQWPFMIVGGHFIIVGIAFFLFYFCVPKESASKSRKVNDDQLASSSNSSYEHEISFSVKASIIAIVSIFSHIYFGVVISFANLLPTFAVKSAVGMTKTEAASLMTVFWLSTTLYRIPVILVSSYISHTTMIVVHVIIMVLSTVGMLFLAETYVWALYALTATMGIGIGPVFAAVLGYLQQYFPVTGRITSIFIVSACVGEFLYPWIITRYLEKDPRIFLYVMSACSIIDLLAFGGCYLLCNLVVRKYSAKRKLPSSSKERY